MSFLRASTRHRLHRAVLTGCSALAVTAALPQLTAQAQEADPALEEIVVTGIRGSLKRAIDVKRNSDVIVDAIAAEDLGKFPDSNVAESLQRISGVSIDRAGGEGQFVTVRGFGPEFNTVLVNGRSIATENQGREFSFDLLASELIFGAEVFKSSTATLQDGGIGSTINVKTARPFDIDGLKIIATARAQYEDLSENVRPNFFAMVSNTFADDRIGALVSVSYQKRDARIDSIETRGFNVNADIPLAGVSGVFVPQNYDQTVEFQDRERVGATAVFQFQATPDLVLTVDGLYNSFDVESRANAIGHWFSADQITNVELDENRTVVRLEHNENGANDFISRTFNRPTDIYAAGFNADWDANEQLNVKLDVSYSRAEQDNGGNDRFAVIGFNGSYTYDNSQGNDLPSILGLPDNLLDPSLGRAHIAIQEGNDVVDEVYEAKFDTSWDADYDHFRRLKFGLHYTDRSKTNNNVRTDPNVLCFFCGYFADVPDNLLSVFDAGNGFLSGFSGDIPRQWLAFNADDLTNFLETSAEAQALRDQINGLPAGTTAAALAAAGGYTAVLQPDSFEVSEEVFAGYVEVDFEGEIGGLPWFITTGARYVHTSQSSEGIQRSLIDLLEIPGDETLYNGVFGEEAPVEIKNSYDKFLPSFNARVDLTHDFVARFAASKTLTRPQLTDLAPRINFTVLRPGNLIAVGGNPNLRPFTSDNFDISLEWYFKEASYLTLGLFYKNVDDFIVSVVGEEDFSVENEDDIPAFEDGVATFQVRRPTNFESANVRGLELAFQYTFDGVLPSPFDGFGVTGNATFVDSNAKVSGGDTSQSFGLEGLGNSQNLIGFYEKDRFAARIAYNRRAGFLQTLSNAVGGDPVFVKTYEQVDVRASYQILENISVFAEGINITNSKVQRHGRFENQVLNVINTGARYAIGVRAEF